MIRQLIQNCRIPGSHGLHDIVLHGTTIEKILPSSDGGGSSMSDMTGMIHGELEENHGQYGFIFDAKGGLVLPGLIEPHIHLEKALLLDRMPGDAASLQEAISMTAALKAGFTEPDMIQRSIEVIRKLSSYGVTRLRCHVEVDPMLGLRAMNSALTVKEKMEDMMGIQIVVFPQEGIISAPGTADLMEEAVRMGADVIGGITYVDPILDDHLNFAFELAARYNRPLDFHVDFSLNAEDEAILHIANKTLDYGFQGRVSAGHVTSLAAMPREKVKLCARKIAEADLHLMTLPATDLYLNGRADNDNTRRGITPVGLLREEGVNVIYGANNIQNAFTPFGNGNPFDIALLLAHTAYMGSEADTDTLVEMATLGAARALGIENYGLRSGAQADLVIFPVQSRRELIIERPRPVGVWKNGRLLTTKVEDGECYEISYR